MAREMKVFGSTIAWCRDDAITNCRQVRAIVAAETKAEAARLMGMSIGEFNNYASQTGNDVEVTLALSKPGQLFARSVNAWKGPYVEITRTPYVSIPRRKRVPYVAPPPPVRFTVEELEMIAGYFSEGNSPLAASIRDKATAMMSR